MPGRIRRFVADKEIQEYAANVRLRAVAHKDFRRVHLDPAVLIVILRDRFAKERVALLGTVAAEGRRVPHLVHGRVQRADHRGGERLRHVADAKADHTLLGSRLLKGRDLMSDFLEEIDARELEKIAVNSCHDVSLSVFLSPEQCLRY